MAVILAKYRTIKKIYIILSILLGINIWWIKNNPIKLIYLNNFFTCTFVDKPFNIHNTCDIFNILI